MLQRQATQTMSISARRILVTGASKGGLGWEAARQLLQQGHELVLTLRDERKAKEAVDALAASGAPRERVHTVLMDLSSFASVRATGKELLQRFPTLDVLLLNAGLIEIGQPRPTATVDGFESTYQVNHLSHFLLTHLLMPALLASTAPGGPRVVAVSSELHGRLQQYPADPTFFHTILTADPKPKWLSMQAYALSKLYNMWFVYKLGRLAQESGVQLSVDGVTPGWVPTTGLGLKGTSLTTMLMRFIMHNVMPLFSGSTVVPMSEGARRLADAAAGPVALASETEADGSKAASGSSPQDKQLVFGSGRYFSKGAARPSSTASYDKDKQDKLWELSLQATGIAPEQYMSGAQQK